MFSKIINFIKYHNAFAIGISLILVLTFSAMASEDVRNALIGEVIVTEQGIDNSQLLAANLENFDINLKIENILEDEENYYVNYTFNTIAVRNNIWQPVVKSEKFTVNKNALGNRDLGIYLVEELSEVAMSEMAFLKEAQKIESEKGKTQIVQTTAYTALLGLVLNSKTRELPGYEPVVKPPEIIVQPQPETIMPSQSPEEMPFVEVGPPQTSTEATSTEATIITEPTLSESTTSTEVMITEPTSTPTSTSTSTSTSSSLSENSTSTEPPSAETSTSTEETAISTEPICQPTDEICDGIDNNCDGNIDENVSCGTTCAEGFSDCDNDPTNGCETATSTCPSDGQ